MKTKIHVFNVNHGDSLLVEIDSDDKTYRGVIDCHLPDQNADSPTLSHLKINNINHLDFVCLTHPDYDHYSGLHQLIKYYSENGRSLNYFYDVGLDGNKAQSVFHSKREKETIIQLYRLIEKLDTMNSIVYRPFSFGGDLIPSLSNKIVSQGPRVAYMKKYERQINNRIENYYNNKNNKSFIDKNLLSIILTLNTDKGPAILLSDAKKEYIEAMLQRWEKDYSTNNQFIFIKVAHHGSRYNHHKNLWKRHIQKYHSVATISSGNKYYLPDEEVVSDIIKSKVKLYCTNKGGALSKLNFVSPSSKQPLASIEPYIEEGLNQITSDVSELTDFSPLHGTISTEIENNKISVTTTHGHPPISSI